MKMNKSDYIFQLLIYHKKDMDELGYHTRKDLNKETLLKIKEIYKRLVK